MLVHHTSKCGKELRGAGAVRGACDAAFSMVKEGPGRSTLKLTKQKDAEEWVGGIEITGHVLTVGQDRKGRDLTSLALTVGQPSHTPTRRARKATAATVRETETQAAFEAVQTSEAPAPTAEAARPLADRAQEALARTPGHEATARALAKEIVRDEIGAEPPSDLVNCRREDLVKAATASRGAPGILALVAVRDGKKRAARFRLPRKDSG